MNPSVSYALKPAAEEDLPFLKELFTDVRGVEFQMLPAAMVEQLLEMQFRAQRMSYAAQYPAAVDEIVWIGGERAGRMLVDTGATEICLVDVALLGRHRGKGVGTALLEQLCERAKDLGRPLCLSVRAGNRAASLYARLGFVATGGDETSTRMEWHGTAAVAVAEDVGTSEAEGEVTQDYTRAYFRTLVGKTLMARTMELPGRPAMVGIELVVDSVQAMSGLGLKVDVGDSFVMELHGGIEETLPQETVEIQPPGGEAMCIFLTAQGPRDGAMRYEAIFNRARPIESDSPAP